MKPVDCEKNRTIIIDLLRSTQREGIENVIKYLDDNGFFEVPSSLNRHHHWRGGLAQHSLGVYEKAKEAGADLPEDSLIICGLLHDICKTRKLYYDAYGNVHKRHTHIQGHGNRSIWILEHCGLKLTEDERRAIRWHMRSHLPKPDEEEDLRIARESRLWLVIHQADHRDAAYR